MDWSDYYTENCAPNPQGPEAVQLFTALTDLWIAFANFEVSLRQFKKTVELFDKAIQDAIVGKSSRIYIQYAEYYLSRSKPASSQKVLVNALISDPPLPGAESDLVWHHFLKTMRVINKSMEWTMKKLHAAVLAELDEKDKPRLAAPPEETLDQPDASTLPQSTAMDVAESKEESDQQPPTVASEQTQPLPPLQEQLPQEQLPQQPPQQQQLTTASSSASAPPTTSITILEEFDGAIAMTGWSAEQLLSSFCSRPHMLFVAPTKEPLVSGLSRLTPTERAELENFLGVSLSTLEKEQQTDSLQCFAAKAILDLLDALYCTQALKERHFDAWISTLRQKLFQEVYRPISPSPTFFCSHQQQFLQSSPLLGERNDAEAQGQDRRQGRAAHRERRASK